MSIEGWARCGYVNPDQITFDFIQGRPYAPNGLEWEAALERWKNIASDEDAVYDDVVTIDGSSIQPTVTWGINPGQGIGIGENIPALADVSDKEHGTWLEALEYMKFEGGTRLEGTPINVAFLGSCTNGRTSDFREVAQYLKGHKVNPRVRAIAVPGSQMVAEECEREGIAQTLRDAGFEWRAAGCSMCLAMNPDRLEGDEICASSSNRNFKGRQGSSTGRTLLMSPLMVAAAAVMGKVVDAREVFGVGELALA